MVNLVKDIAIDWQKYLAAPPEAARVRPASDWTQEVIDHFNGKGGLVGKTLPWSKTHADIAVREGELTVFAGPNGSGKSLILNQIILGLLAQGSKACIASLEMLPHMTLQRLARQGSGVRHPSDDFVREFHEWLNGKLWVYDHTGTMKHDRMIAVIRYCAEELGINVFVVDSLMMCGIKPDDYGAQKEFADMLCACAKDYRMHIFLVAHTRKGDTERKVHDKYDIKGTSELSDMADVVLMTWRNKEKEDALAAGEADERTRTAPDAMLICSKQRHGSGWEGKIFLWFHADSMQYVARDGARPIDFMALAERSALQGG